MVEIHKSSALRIRKRDSNHHASHQIFITVIRSNRTTIHTLLFLITRNHSSLY